MRRIGAATRVAVYLALVSTSAAFVSGCRGGAMTPYRFGKDADSLSSMATEGAYLADGVADGRITAAFVRAHAQELASDSEKLSSVVASTHPDEELASKTDALAALGTRVTAELRALADDPSDRAQAAILRSALSDAADRASKLGSSA